MNYNVIPDLLILRDDLVRDGRNADAEAAQVLLDRLIAPIAGAGPAQPAAPAPAPQPAPVPMPAPQQGDVDDLPF